jgi:hypothetical protein
VRSGAALISRAPRPVRRRVCRPRRYQRTHRTAAPAHGGPGTCMHGHAIAGNRNAFPLLRLLAHPSMVGICHVRSERGREVRALAAGCGGADSVTVRLAPVLMRIALLCFSGVHRTTTPRPILPPCGPHCAWRALDWPPSWRVSDSTRSRSPLRSCLRLRLIYHVAACLFVDYGAPYYHGP